MTTALVQDEPELNFLEWARWKRNLLITGSYDPNLWHTLSSRQKWWTKETMNTLKALQVNEDYKID